MQIAHRSIACYGKPNLSAVALGVHHKVFELTREYAKQRSIYGRPLAALEITELGIGKIYTNLSLARLAAYRAMAVLDRNRDADEEIILAKNVSTELALESAKAAMDIFGARGTSRAMRIERFLCDILMVFPPAGTSDIHRKRIAEIALGRYVHSSVGSAGTIQQREVA